MFLGFCPACNSDAPEVDTCPVCRQYREMNPGSIGIFPPPKEVIELWKINYQHYLKNEEIPTHEICPKGHKNVDYMTRFNEMWCPHCVKFYPYKLKKNKKSLLIKGLVGK